MRFHNMRQWFSSKLNSVFLKIMVFQVALVCAHAVLFILSVEIRQPWKGGLG